LSIQDYFRSITERLESSASVKTIYGEPIVADGKTVIPVGRVAYAFCTCSRPERKDDTKQQMEAGMAEGCGGGAVAASPLGVVEITKEDTRFIPIDEKTRLAGALLVGFFLGLLMVSRRSSR
jgi:uncharacterized spore protein YtfJ